MATLGISTNTRLLGIAIIKEGVLLDYFIRLHKSPWSPAKVSEIITSLEPCVRVHCIKKAVLSIPHSHYQSEAVSVLYEGIREYFLKQDIEIVEVPAKEMYGWYAPGEKKVKAALMKTLCKRFPELSICQKKELRNKTKYYHKLFEAVGVAALEK